MTQSIQNKKRQKLYTQKQKKKETSNYIKTTHTSESSNMSSSTEVKDRHFLITSTGAHGNQTQVCQVNPTVCLNRWSMAAYQFQVQMTTSRSLNTLPDATYSSQSEWHVGHLGGHLLQASHFNFFFQESKQVQISQHFPDSLHLSAPVTITKLQFKMYHFLFQWLDTPTAFVRAGSPLHTVKLYWLKSG